MKAKKVLSLALAVLTVAMLLCAAFPVAAETAPTVWDGTYPEANAAATYSGGTGVADDPYLISTAADLAQLKVNVDTNAGEEENGYSHNKFFKLTADLDLNSKPWSGIGSAGLTARAKNPNPAAAFVFCGSFEGDNHVIKNLTPDTNTDIAAGLFSAAGFGASIKNLGVVSGSINVTGDTTYIGALVAVVAKNGFTMSNCYNLIDIVSNGTAITVEQSIGGLVGVLMAHDSTVTIENCFNSGSINANGATGKPMKVGGLIGRVLGGETGTINLTNCTNVGDLAVAGGTPGGNNIGSLVGYFELIAYNLTNCNAGGNIATIALNNKTVGVIGCSSVKQATSFVNCTFNCPITVTDNATAVYDQVVIGKCWNNTISPDGFTKVEETIRIEDACFFTENGYQQGTDDLSKVRLLSELCVSTAMIEKVGFELTLTYGDVTKTATVENSKVYTSVLAGTQSCTPTVGDFYVAYGIKNMPVASGDAVVITYRPYAELTDGTVVYGSASTLNFEGGIKQ